MRLICLSSSGWHVYGWLSYVPILVSKFGPVKSLDIFPISTLFKNFFLGGVVLQMVLVLGTKLEVIVARMALQIKEQDNVIIGTPLVKPNDNLFWFGKPRFVLTLLHYTLFVVILFFISEN